MPVRTQLNLARIQELINLSHGEEPIAIDQLMLDIDFDDIGIDSLALIELVDRIQEAYGVPIDDDIVQSLRTPRKLLDHVNTWRENRDT